MAVSDTRQLLLESHFPRLCKQHGLSLQPSPEALVDALLNTAPERYPGRFMPELALHIADSTFNRARNRISFLQQEPANAASVEDLWAHIVDEQGLNPEIFGADPKTFYVNLRKKLTSKVIGQDHAVEQICSVLEMQGQRPPQRAPRGRFLFVGPPGVGKTQLARSLAKELGYGDEGFFVFNMSEYSSESARTRFMGADPGYVGFSNTRTIYQSVRERPACVILLDEIDRADASIQDILLSIMEGEGKDAEGQPVYFSQAIFVMTTNLGQEAVQTAYQEVTSGALTRQQLVQKFADEQLRRLVLEGATDETEVAMQSEVDKLVEDAKTQFAAARQSVDEGGTIQALGRYADLKELRARLERSIRTSPLDRALLDRVDFIIPFFPVKERALLEKILELKLESFGWEDCPAETKQTILAQAVAQRESVRPLERLIKRYLCKEAS
jgi:ATP-dependent Clp protease ATP-binding subunit ClpA